MCPRVSRGIAILFCLGASLVAARANTTITFTRAEIANMSMLWETDCISISPLANAQYPNIAGSWDFIFPHTSISSDGDIHIDMAIDSSGTGATGNNTGESPLICEVINASSTQLNHLDGMTDQQATFRGIFRFYTEHAGERHFELHPVTQLQRWNGSTFIGDTDYYANIVTVPDGASHAMSTLTGLLNGSQTMTATIAGDNTNVTLNCPSPSVNYVQYDGVVVSGLQSDALSQYFIFQPNLVPDATVRCRLIANTGAASAAAGLVASQAITVNALTRTDMGGVAAQIASMSANQQKSFARPVELIVLALPTIGPSPTPTPTALTFINSASISIRSGRSGETKANPYPSAIAVTGVAGVVSKVSVALNGLNTVSPAYPEDIDILLAGPSGQNTMLMSDVGGGGQLSNVNLLFDDNAASQLSASQITSGSYQPTNLNPSGDKDAFPAPAPSQPFGGALSIFNGTNPNGTWSLFVLDEYTSGSGSIANGWSIMLSTIPSAPFAATKPASNITSTTATLNGTINPLGQNSSYDFQIGSDTSYPFVQDAQFAGSGTDTLNVSVSLSGLTPGFTYHFRLSGANASGVTMGSDLTFTTSSFMDSDGDLMPDDYEIAQGFDPSSAGDAAIDSDGDGLSNVQEYEAGTDPLSAVSVLRISAIQTVGGDVVITFPSVFGKTYRVEQRTDLSVSWMTLSENIHGTGGAVSITDVEAVDQQARRFYRVVVTQ
ncbi:MAG: serralysin [Verrucomicrobiota bacterium]